MRSTPRGIDVTAHNGPFDWAAWKGQIEFGLVEATQGTDYIDPQFITNWDTMSAMEIVRFAFHWFTDADPAAQAEHFVATMHTGALTEYDGLVLYLDPEYVGAETMDTAFAAYVFTREVWRLTGHLPVIMTDTGMIEAGYCAMLGDCGLWVIDYDTPVPHVAGPWRTWDFWQYAGNNVGLSVFNGTNRQLDKI